MPRLHLAPPRRAYALLFAVVLAVAALPSPPGAAVADTTAPRITVLPSGLTVATSTRPDSELVTVAVSVRAGGRYEPPSLRGGSHWLEHMHFLGSRSYPDMISQDAAISRFGGDFNAATSTETTTFWATVPAARFAVAFDVLADMMQHPLFPPDPVERERGVVQEELRGQTVTPLVAAGRTLATRLLGVAGQDAGGTVESVGRIDVAELLRYRAERYTARNMVIAVSGPMAHEDVVAAAVAGYHDLPSGMSLLPDPVADAPDNVLVLGTSPGAPIVVVGQRIPGADSDDVAPLDLLDAVLDGPGTRIFDAIDDALDTEGGTRITFYQSAGLWYAYANTGPNNADKVLTAVQTEIRRLQDTPVPEAELAAARRYFAGRLRLGGDSTRNEATALASGTVQGVYRGTDAFAERVLAVTPADIQRVARAYFDADRFSVIALARPTRSP